MNVNGMKSRSPNESSRSTIKSDNNKLRLINTLQLVVKHNPITHKDLLWFCLIDCHMAYANIYLHILEIIMQNLHRKCNWKTAQ